MSARSQATWTKRRKYLGRPGDDPQVVATDLPISGESNRFTASHQRQPTNHYFHAHAGHARPTKLLLVYVFQVRVAVQTLFVEVEEGSAFFVGEAAFAERGFDIAAQHGDQDVGRELDVVQHLADGIALNHRIENHVAVGAQAYMHGVGIAEEIVEVAQNLLIRAQQERAQVIVAAVEGVELQGALDVAAVDEGVHLAIGITGDIAQHRRARGLLFQAVDRHDGEKLLDGPTVRRSEERRVRK